MGRKRMRQAHQFAEDTREDSESNHDRNLYSILGVAKNASPVEIKKAYYKASLKCHPDKIPPTATEDERISAKETFQQLGKAYTVLADEQRRKIYDETGIIDDECSSDDWGSYFRAMFEQVSLEVLERTKKSYQGSEEERLDLLEYYVEFKGDMNKIMDHLYFYSTEEEPRYLRIIEKAIKDGDVKSYTRFKNTRDTTPRKRRESREAKEAEQYQEELGLSPKADIFQVIRQKQQENHEELLNRITQKYVEKEKKQQKKKRKEEGLEDDSLLDKNLDEDPLSDEAFRALQARLFGKGE